MHRTAIVPALALLAFAACESESPTGPYWEEHISLVSSVSLPDTAIVGVEFLVFINTYGGFENSYMGEDVVTAIDGGFLITPYDWERYGLTIKNRAGQSYRHIVPLTVHEPGLLKVDVRALDHLHPDGSTVVTISNQVVVVYGGNNI